MRSRVARAGLAVRLRVLVAAVALVPFLAHVFLDVAGLGPGLVHLLAGLALHLLGLVACSLAFPLFRLALDLILHDRKTPSPPQVAIRTPVRSKIGSRPCPPAFVSTHPSSRPETSRRPSPSWSKAS